MVRVIALTLAVALGAIAQPCTIFIVARGGAVLAGANEDMTNAPPYDKHWVHFQPARDKNAFGFVSFGYNQFPLVAQAAMNEKGLFYDYNALPKDDRGPEGKPKESVLIIQTMLERCATVAQAVDFLSRYDIVGLSTGQMVIGDATGASAILERNAVTYRGRQDFQIGTNFRTSTTPKAKITCDRFKKCDAALRAGGPVGVTEVLGLLKATSANTKTGITWYSMVCDLKEGKIILFRKANFDAAVTLGLKAELAKGSRRTDIDALFAAESKAFPG